MHKAAGAVQVEGTVSNGQAPRTRSARSRQWLKAQHRVEQKLQVAGWRPSTPARPGGLILAEHSKPIGVGVLAIPERQSVALIDLLQRYGRRNPLGSILIPDDRIQAIGHYTARTPIHGHLRDAFSFRARRLAQTALTVSLPVNPFTPPGNAR